MSDVEITIKLPEELVEQARAGGVPITGESVAAMIENELVRAEAVRRLREAMQKLEGTLSLQEIEDELTRPKADRLTENKKN